MMTYNDEIEERLGPGDVGYVAVYPMMFSGSLSNLPDITEEGAEVKVIRYDNIDDSYLIEDQTGSMQLWVDAAYIAATEPYPPVTDDEMKEVMRSLGVDDD